MENYIEMPRLDGVSNEGMNFINQVLPDFDFNALVNELSVGNNVFKPDSILEWLINIFAGELYSTVKILTLIVAIVMISAILENLQTSFGKSNTYNTGFVTMALIMGLAIELFSQSSSYAKTVAHDLTTIMNALLPVMMTLVAGSGHITVGAMTNPVLFYMCNIFGILFDRVLIPMSVTYLAISQIGLLSETIKLDKFRELIKKSYNFILGIIMTIFTGLLGAGSFTGVALDSIGAKGAKFALSNMVPFVGRSISEAMNAVASASLVLKNAVGITGIVVMLALCIIPILKIAAIILCIRAATAICESIASYKTMQILTSVGDGLSMINASVISITVMMIISIGIIVGLT